MKYKVGDIVIICSAPRIGQYVTWESAMDEYCGCSGEILKIDWIEDCQIYFVKSTSKQRQEKSFWFQENWIVLDTGYYWTAKCSREEFQKLGLDQLKREEASIKEKQDAIFRKIFKDN